MEFVYYSLKHKDSTAIVYLHTLQVVGLNTLHPYVASQKVWAEACEKPISLRHDPFDDKDQRFVHTTVSFPAHRVSEKILGTGNHKEFQAENLETGLLSSSSAEVTDLLPIPHTHITKPLFRHKSPTSSHLEPIFTL
ncbi:hypothetical protein NQZ68_027375 [Dissostichus eleginoides]|nr:hypothetical protein NQZ68_027375 [Dissostichus eleginoides]